MMEIIPMQHRDIPAVCAIEQAVFADAWSEQTVTDSFESPFGVWLVIRDEDGVPKAYLGGMCIAGEAEIYRVAAHPEHRRQGLGEQLVRALAAMNGVDAIVFTAGIGENNSDVRQMVGDGCDLLIGLIEGKDIAPQTVYYQSQMILRDTTK